VALEYRLRESDQIALADKVAEVVRRQRWENAA
jgi:hypothetical protein